MSHASINANAAAAQLTAAMTRVQETQQAAIVSAAELVADTLGRDGVIHAFGTGHSRAFAMEIAGRAGGLIPTNQLAIKDLVLFGGADPADILDPTCERDATIAERVWKLHDVRTSDVLAIASNSGGNGATIEMARLAKGHGNPVIAVTSLDHTRQITPSHPSGQRLAEVADVVIDNCAPYGDASLEMPNGGSISPVSTVTSALIAQMLVAEACGLLLSNGSVPPVLQSVNTPGGEDHNNRLQAHYEGRIRRHEP